MKCAMNRKPASWFLATLSTGLVAWIVYSLLSLGQEPTRSARILMAEVVGGELVMSVEVKMTRKCDAMIVWWVLDKDEREVIASDTQPARPSTIGTRTIVTRRKVPSMPPGTYQYKGLIFDICTNGKLYTTGTQKTFVVKD